MIAPSRGIVPHDSRVIVARQQCHQRRGILGCVGWHFSCSSIAMGHPGLSSCPPWAVAIGWPERERSTSHVAKMLDQSERMELNVVYSALASIPRHPWLAWSTARELQYSCNRCLCFHFHILTRLHSRTGVPWCQSPIISETTSNSSHQYLKLTRRAAPTTRSLRKGCSFAPSVIK
jgi:hypothetical protein